MNLVSGSMNESPVTSHDVTYFTVSDHRFFPGTVALVNSLALTGSAGRIVILDSGMTDAERQRLSPHATVVQPPERIHEHPILMKPYPLHLRPSGIVVIIDSDVIVAGSLDPVLRLASQGKICAVQSVRAARCEHRPSRIGFRSVRGDGPSR